VKRPEIDLFIFDEGGVMIRDFYVLPEMARLLGLDQGTLGEMIRPDMGDYSRGRIDGAEFWRRFSLRTGIRPGADYFASLFHPSPIQESFALVKELAARHRIVCGTNTIDSHHGYNGSHGYYEGFHKVYASHLLGEAKPDREFWLAILEEERVSPERCFFVDDMQANIDAAASLGMETWLFSDPIALRTHLEALGAFAPPLAGPSRE
jgi:glucose-1-phosphatase